MHIAIWLFCVVSFSIFAKEAKNISLVDKLQILEREIGLETETAHAKGITKGTYVAIYSDSEKVFELEKELQFKSLFPLASVSKPFTAFAMLKLIEGGYAKFHDPITKYIPEFKEVSFLGEPITIIDLLQQVSGIPNSSATSWVKLSIGTKEFTIPKQIYPTKKKFIYSNHNYRILAKLVEIISNQSLGDYLTEVLFAPLSIQEVKTEHFDGAAGMLLSAEGLFQFANVILHAGKVGDTQVFMDKTIKNFFRKSKVLIDSKSYYGMGWFVEFNNKQIKKIWHTGSGDYSYSRIQIYPKEKIISIFFNLQTKRNPEKFSKMNSSLEKSIENYVYTFERLKQQKRNSNKIPKNPR